MTLHRPTLGILAILLLSVAAALAFLTPEDGHYSPYTSACLRVGVVLAVLWLALPDTRPLQNRLLIAGILLAAVVFVVRPSLIILAVKHPLVLGIVAATIYLLKILRPRRKTAAAECSRKASSKRNTKSD